MTGNCDRLLASLSSLEDPKQWCLDGEHLGDSDGGTSLYGYLQMGIQAELSEMAREPPVTGSCLVDWVLKSIPVIVGDSLRTCLASLVKV